MQVWRNNEIAQLLASLGLPQDSALSVLVVETLPQVTNIFEHISRLEKPGIAQAASHLVGEEQQDEFKQRIHATEDFSFQNVDIKKPSPVSDELGHHRLLRTSPLTEVPDICNYE